MAGEGSNKTSRGEKATTQKVAVMWRQTENQREIWRYFLYRIDCWLGSALDPVFGRISVMDNPTNSFSVWLWSSVGITLQEFVGGGRQAAFSPAIVAFVMSRNLLSARPSPCFQNTCFNLNSRRYPVLACPKTMLVFSSRCWKCGEGGWGKSLVDYCPGPIAHPSSSHTVPLFNMLEITVRLGVFCQASWNGGAAAGGGEESLTGVSLSWAQRAQQIDPPLPPPPPPPSPPLQHRQTWSTGARPTLSIHPLLPPASNYWRSASKPKSNGKHRICCAFKYTCSWPKITPRAAPIVTDHASDCHSSGKVAAFKRSQGCSGERDRRSWPSFLVWSENLCTSALPPPKPKPLLLQAAKGAPCAARQAARFVSEHCPGSPCTHPTPFPSFQAWQCWIYPGGRVWFAPLATMELEGSDGWRWRTWERLKQVAATTKTLK